MTNRELFDFVTDISLLDDAVEERLESIQRTVQDRLMNPLTAEQQREADMEEALFRKAFIPTSLDQVNDIEGDIHMLEQGKEDQLYYTALVGLTTVSPPKEPPEAAAIGQGKGAVTESTAHDTDCATDHNSDANSAVMLEYGQDGCDDDDVSDGDDSDGHSEWVHRDAPSTETPEEKRLRKQAVKEANREKRKNKMPKHIKKKKYEKQRK